MCLLRQHDDANIINNTENQSNFFYKFNFEVFFVLFKTISNQNNFLYYTDTPFTRIKSVPKD